MLSTVKSFPALLPRATSMHSLYLAAALATVIVFAGSGAAFAGSASNGEAMGSKNVLGEDLAVCSTDPMTGYFREGKCETGPSDFGTHTVCAKVTREFLEYTRQKGNDLVTPRPEYNFPGLKPGDGWCLCASRWREAMQSGVAPPVVLAATHTKTLQYVGMDALREHAADGGIPGAGSE